MNAHTLVWSALAMQVNPAPVPKSTLMWMIEATNSMTGLFALVSGVAIFIGACRVVTKGRRTSTIAAYLVLLPLPTFIGMLGFLKGISASLMVIAESGMQPSAAEWIAGFGESAFLMFVCLLVTLPSYLVLAFGMLWRECDSSSAPAPRRTTGPLPVVGFAQPLMGEQAMG